MAKDEVELGGKDAGEDYEVVPVGPIRKLERRIDDMEEKAQKGGMGGGRNDELVRDVLDIMKSNQKIVNDMTESTHELKNSVEDLTHKMDSVIDNMNSFMDLLQDASEADLEGGVMQDVHSRVADAVGDRMEDVAADMRDSNQQVVNHLEQLNESVRRSYAAENKDQVLSGNSRQQNSGSRQPNPQNRQQNQRRQGNQGGLNIERGNDNTQDNRDGRRSRGNQDSDRMNKLRKRFDKMDDEK
jgi:archaellum component FlaC